MPSCTLQFTQSFPSPWSIHSAPHESSPHDSANHFKIGNPFISDIVVNIAIYSTLPSFATNCASLNSNSHIVHPLELLYSHESSCTQAQQGS